MTPIRIGTCSWADEALSKYFYPRGTRRAPVARAPRRGLRPLPRRARAAARGRQARWDPLPAAAVRRPQGGLARLPLVGARPARRRGDARRVPARKLARGERPRGDA